MGPVDQEFQSAPTGARPVAAMAVAMGAALVGGAVAVGVAWNAHPAHARPSERAIAFLAPVAALLIVVPVYFYQRSRVERFRIEGGCLVLGRKRYPLQGLVGIARDPDILRWAFRIRGSGGLGAARGRYWSKRVGKFDAFMTNAEKAVVLRWPDRVVAVSPSDPEFFIMCARSAAGLK